jgi:hypothetical protein
MCDYCRQYSCPSSCPSYDGNLAGLDKELGTCFLCEERVYPDEKHFMKNEKYLCEHCASELISPELLAFLDCEDTEDFFDMLY